MDIQVHGALVEVLGVGVLLCGPSGVGKSECALELVRRRHRLVADDVVRIRSKHGDGAERTKSNGVASPQSPVLLGRSPELIRHYMEIRGIGLLCIPDLYGPDAVKMEARIELICHMEQWREEADYERLGLERPTTVLAGVAIPALVLPVRPAHSMATLVEVAVRDHRQRCAGVNAAKRIDAQLRRVAAKSPTGEGDGDDEGGREVGG